MSSIRSTGVGRPGGVSPQPESVSIPKAGDKSSAAGNLPAAPTAQETKSSQQLAASRKAEFGFSSIFMNLNTALDATKNFGEKIAERAKNDAPVEPSTDHDSGAKRGLLDEWADIETSVVGGLSKAGDLVENTAHSVTGKIKETTASLGEKAGEVAAYSISHISPEHAESTGEAVSKTIAKAGELFVAPTELAYSGIAETLRAPQNFDKAVQTTAQGIQTGNLERAISGIGGIVEHGATIAVTVSGAVLAAEAALAKLTKRRGMGIPINRDVSQMGGAIGKALSAEKATRAGEKILGDEVKAIVKWQDPTTGKIMKKKVKFDLVTEGQDGKRNLVESKYVKTGTDPKAARTGDQKYAYRAIEELGKDNVEIIPVGGNAEAAGLEIGKPLEKGSWNFRQETWEF